MSLTLAMRPRRRQSTCLLIAGVLSVAALSGCGQKGPLYIPDSRGNGAGNANSPNTEQPVPESSSQASSGDSRIDDDTG